MLFRRQQLVKLQRRLRGQIRNFLLFFAGQFFFIAQLQKAVKFQHSAACTQLVARRADKQSSYVVQRSLHLAGHGAVPDKRI